MLTDDPPEIEPLKVHRDASSGAFRLIFEPWISEETVRRAYRSVQLGDNRPLERKCLAAFLFVTAHTEPGEKPKWAELTRRWNKRFPNYTLGRHYATRCACSCGTTKCGKARKSGRLPEKVPGSLSRALHTGCCMWTSENAPARHLGEWGKMEDRGCQEEPRPAK